MMLRVTAVMCDKFYEKMGSTWKLNFALFMALCFTKLQLINAALEPGVVTYTVSSKEVIAISKSMYNSTNVTVIANCEDSDCQIKLKWVLRFSDCDNAFVDNINTTVLLSNPESSMLQFENIIRFQQSIAGNETETCDHKTMFQDQSILAPIQCRTTVNGDIAFCKEEKNKGKDEEKDKGKDEGKNKGKDEGKNKKEKEENKENKEGRRKRASEGDPKSSSKPPTTAKQPTNANPPATSKPPTTAKQPTPAKQSTPANQPTSNKPKVPNRVTNTWQDGRYIFVFSIETDCENPSFNITIEFESEHGYLSATQKPLLTFYAVMCAAYTILAFLWLLMMACQWRDILRIQFWICGVVILGLLEKVVFYSEYHHMNKTGFSSPAALIFAELVSCLKRTVARMLVIIVSMGFGITKPRLGPQLHRVIGVGFLFFVLSSIEACLRVQGSVQQDLVASIPLAVLDAVICYWIFTNLVDTTRTLRLRRNLVKLWLYRHFTNCLIFCIVAAIIFLVWSMKEHKAAVCVTRWTELWLDDAYWHILFYIVLVVIIILWRPTANNQRYAYSPLTDALDDDESKEPMIPESFEGMKMRNVNRTDSTPNKVEDDLKWIEDNIPASVADAALAAFDDSDEEIVTNIERSKME